MRISRVHTPLIQNIPLRSFQPLVSLTLSGKKTLKSLNLSRHRNQRKLGSGLWCEDALGKQQQMDGDWYMREYIYTEFTI
ncbi:hypothetical protein MKW98_007529 [Papaver atlanticum]|uniref:Uncharacterized protein n=1 Tax=Papaver atlanticum TaxID=357466 RepID=A0AAD4SCL7_9MAGN|nr:hypothetical protein MKW98_007529 [Papaver atlanticum]